MIIYLGLSLEKILVIESSPNSKQSASSEVTRVLLEEKKSILQSQAAASSPRALIKQPIISAVPWHLTDVEMIRAEGTNDPVA